MMGAALNIISGSTVLRPRRSAPARNGRPHPYSVCCATVRHRLIATAAGAHPMVGGELARGWALQVQVGLRLGMNLPVPGVVAVR